MLGRMHVPPRTFGNICCGGAWLVSLAGIVAVVMMWLLVVEALPLSAIRIGY